MKTVVITITHGIVVRNILRTDVFKILKSRRDLRIVLAVLHRTPFFNSKSFAAEFSGENVIVENVGVKSNIVERALRKIAEMIFFNINYNETIRIKEMTLKKKSYFGYLGLKLVKKVLGKNKNVIEALKSLDVFLFGYKHKYYRELFEKYKPSLIFSTDFLWPHEWGLIRAAEHYDVPVVSMVLSWDHLSKGRLPTRFGKVIVWNDFLKGQLMEYYDYSPNDIFVSGIPHFDYYIHDKGRLSSRREFLKNVGTAPNEKLITYTTSPPTVSPFEQDVIEIVCEAIKNGEIKYPSHLHVRFHPADNFGRYEKLKKYGNIVTFEIPGKSVSRAGYTWGPDREDMLHYADLLLHSDVIINIASTVSIDASAFDTPVINIAFDGYEEKSYFDSVIRYYDQTHYKKVVGTGGVKIAKNKEELIRYINDYLRNPKLDSEGRKKIVREQCYRLDGKSGKRIALYILSFLKK